MPPRGLPGSRIPGSEQRVGVLGVGVAALPGGPGRTEVEWEQGCPRGSWPRALGRLARGAPAWVSERSKGEQRVIAQKDPRLKPAQPSPWRGPGRWKCESAAACSSKRGEGCLPGSSEGKEGRGAGWRGRLPIGDRERTVRGEGTARRGWCPGSRGGESFKKEGPVCPVQLPQEAACSSEPASETLCLDPACFAWCFTKT